VPATPFPFLPGSISFASFFPFHYSYSVRICLNLACCIESCVRTRVPLVRRVRVPKNALAPRQLRVLIGDQVSWSLSIIGFFLPFALSFNVSFLQPSNFQFVVFVLVYARLFLLTAKRSPRCFSEQLDLPFSVSHQDLFGSRRLFALCTISAEAKQRSRRITISPRVLSGLKNRKN